MIGLNGTADQTRLQSMHCFSLDEAVWIFSCYLKGYSVLLLHT